MRINSLQIHNFRSIKGLTLPLPSGLTVLVGENNVGKTTIGAAIYKLLLQTAETGDTIDRKEYHYQTQQPLTLSITLELSSEEIHSSLLDPIPPHYWSPADRYSQWREWVDSQPREITLQLTRPQHTSNYFPAEVTWGQFSLYGERFAYGPKPDLAVAPVTIDWSNTPSKIKEHSPDEGTVFGYPINMVQNLGKTLCDRFKLIPEFRTSPAFQRTGFTEALTGAETAGALLTLKNHSNRHEAARYREIQDTFHKLIPRFTFEAVEEQPGAVAPDVQFYEVGQDSPIPLSLVGAGIKQVLALLTTLLGRDELVIFLEHPEQHLHPHSMHFLQTVLHEVAKRNQLIIVTHDPHFVPPEEPEALRRVWWTRAEGTTLHGLGAPLKDTERNQIQTVLRQLGNRDMVFARSVVLVEDDTHAEFLAAVAPTLKHAIGAEGISIVPVGGETCYRPFQVLLEALQIPYVALKDNRWGDRIKYPAEHFFDLGKEIEAYLDEHGLKEKREKLIAKLGRGSKRRIAGPLGSQLRRREIPPIFDDVLKAAIKLQHGTI